MRVGRLAARRAVGDALAGEPLEAVDVELTPRHPGREDDRLRAQHVALVEVDLARRRIDPLDGARDEDLRPEPPGLLQRAAGQLVPRHPGREAEVVLDPRGGAGLAAGRLALDDDRAQPLRRPVDRGRQPRGSGSDDHGVVLRGARLGPQAQQLGDPAQARPDDGLAVDDADGRQVEVGGQRPAPALLGVRRVGRDPLERDLVAVEEAAQVGGVAVPAVTDDDRPWRARLGREALQPPRAAHPVRGEIADGRCDLGRDGGDLVVVARLQPHDARALRGAEADREHRAEHDRDLAEDLPGLRTPTTRSMPSICWTGSMRPSRTANNARSPPWGAAYSPGTRLMSAAARERRSRADASSPANSPISPISSAVTIVRHPAARPLHCFRANPIGARHRG